MVERRMLDSVKLVLIFNERHSCVAFPSLKGKPDLNIVYYSDNNSFHEWCEDYFATSGAELVFLTRVSCHMRFEQLELRTEF